MLGRLVCAVGGAVVPQAATTWKLRIRWKESTHISCFVSTARRVSTLTAARPRWPGRCPARGPQWHHVSLELAASRSDASGREARLASLPDGGGRLRETLL